MRALYRASDARKTMACMKRPAAKRSRTEQLGELESFRRNVPHVSASALSAILKEGKARGLPELDSRDDIRAVRDAAVDTETEYGPLYQVNEDMPLKKGGKSHFCFIHPLALLAVMLSTCIEFSNYVEGLHLDNPSSEARPWRLIL